jgi:hypothetical protein
MKFALDLRISTAKLSLANFDDRIARLPRLAALKPFGLRNKACARRATSRERPSRFIHSGKRVNFLPSFGIS